MPVIKVGRSLIKHFYGIGALAASATFYLCAPFTKVNEENNPEMDDVAFVNDVNSSPSVAGYKNAFDYEAQYHDGDEVVDDLVNIAYTQKTGSDAERWLVAVNFHKPSLTAIGSYYARLFKIAVESGAPNGDPKKITKVSGKFHQIGDVTEGLYNPVTGQFTADSAPTTYAVTMTVVPAATAEVIIRDEDGVAVEGVSVNALTGVVTIPNLANGTYEYIVFADGYITDQDTFVVESATEALGTITLVSGT